MPPRPRTRQLEKRDGQTRQTNCTVREGRPKQAPLFRPRFTYGTYDHVAELRTEGLRPRLGTRLTNARFFVLRGFDRFMWVTDVSETHASTPWRVERRRGSRRRPDIGGATRPEDPLQRTVATALSGRSIRRPGSTTAESTGGWDIRTEDPAGTQATPRA